VHADTLSQRGNAALWLREQPPPLPPPAQQGRVSPKANGRWKRERRCGMRRAQRPIRYNTVQYNKIVSASALASVWLVPGRLVLSVEAVRPCSVCMETYNGLDQQTRTHARCPCRIADWPEWSCSCVGSRRQFLFSRPIAARLRAAPRAGPRLAPGVRRRSAARGGGSSKHANTSVRVK